jgi:hypothetical protein
LNLSLSTSREIVRFAVFAAAKLQIDRMAIGGKKGGNETQKKIVAFTTATYP